MDDSTSKSEQPRTSSASRSTSHHDTRKSFNIQKPIDLDDVLINEIGQFGRFQMINILLVAIPIIMSAFMSEFIFSAAAIPHRCRIPECGEDSKDNDFEPGWILNAIPTDSNNNFVSCSRYGSLDNGTLESCPASLFDNSISDCNGDFVYARDNTVVYDFNLGCQDWLRALAGTLSNVGTLLVLPVTGYVSDKFGRRVALIISVFNLALFGFIRAFSVNYPMYLALQLLQTTLGAGTFSSSHIFATEFVGPRYRVLAGAICAAMFSIGQIILGGIAWLVQPWRYMLMTLHIPCFIIVIYYWLLQESVRWLLSKKKFSEAKIVLQNVAKINKKEISEKSMEALMNPPLPPNGESDEKISIFKAVFNSSTLFRRVLTTPVWWITTTFVYYGLSINATGLSDTMYLNYILTSAVELPSFFVVVFILDILGRKPILSGGFFLTAACNISFAFIPQNLATLRLVIYLLGKLGISIVFSALYIYTSELYPTEYRHSFLAFSSMIGRLGSIIAPLTPVLMNYWAGIPSIMFGVMACISGVLVLTQPETLGTKMPDTLAEAEAIGKSKSMSYD